MRKEKKHAACTSRKLLTFVMAMLLSAGILAPAVPHSDILAASAGQVKMYRMYNPNSGEHFYTASDSERNTLEQVGWTGEGTGWIAPSYSSQPVYRLYNPNAGDHHYTMDTAERRRLISYGWRDEGIGWYSDTSKRVAVYREYNPNARTGTHNYTPSLSEHNNLVRAGWRNEGIGWYAVSEFSLQGTYGWWSQNEQITCIVDASGNFDLRYQSVDFITQNNVVRWLDANRDAATGRLNSYGLSGTVWSGAVSSYSRYSAPSTCYWPDSNYRYIYRTNYSGFTQGHSIKLYRAGTPKSQLPYAIRIRPIYNGAYPSSRLERDCLYDETSQIVLYEGAPGLPI